MTYLSDQNNSRHQENCNERGRLSKKVGIVTQKHDRNQGLPRTCFQKHYCVLLYCLRKCFHLVTAKYTVYSKSIFNSKKSHYFRFFKLIFRLDEDFKRIEDYSKDFKKSHYFKNYFS